MKVGNIVAVDNNGLPTILIFYIASFKYRCRWRDRGTS